MPKSDWNIIYYETSSGSMPVYDFIESLSPVAKSKVSNTFDLLTEYGIKLGLPHVKKVFGTDLWEYGFIKKSQKAPKKEIRIALARLKEYKLRKS